MRNGFTLIELLVVITIIVVLLALLTPALDKAIYQAELAVCGANLKAGGNGVTVYSAEHRRYYPDRPSEWMPPFQFYDREGSPDLRPVLQQSMSIDDVFNCPLNEDVDFLGSSDSTQVYGDYNMWFGYRYQDERGMYKLGDRMGYEGDSFNYLISDQSRTGNDGKPLANSSHPDHWGIMASESVQDEGLPPFFVATLSWWDTHTTVERGPVDMNFAVSDGSIERRMDVPWDAGEPDNPDATMAKLPQDADHRNPNLFVHLPIR